MELASMGHLLVSRKKAKLIEYLGLITAPSLDLLEWQRSQATFNLMAMMALTFHSFRIQRFPPQKLDQVLTILMKAYLTRSIHELTNQAIQAHLHSWFPTDKTNLTWLKLPVARSSWVKQERITRSQVSLKRLTMQECSRSSSRLAREIRVPTETNLLRIKIYLINH